MRRRKFCGAGISDALSHLFLKRLKWSGFTPSGRDFTPSGRDFNQVVGIQLVPIFPTPPATTATFNYTLILSPVQCLSYHHLKLFTLLQGLPLLQSRHIQNTKDTLSRSMIRRPLGSYLPVIVQANNILKVRI